MSPERPPPGVSLPLTILERIEGVWLGFEDACKAGEEPRIEAYLGDRVDPDRSALLHELLRLDLTCRRLRGQRPTTREYEDRFPQDVALIRKSGTFRFSPGCLSFLDN